MRGLSNLPPGVTDAMIDEQAGDDGWDEMVEQGMEIIRTYRRDHDNADGVDEYDLLDNEFPGLSRDQLEHLLEEVQDALR